MQESLPSEHSGELLRYSLEQFLDSGGVTDEGSCHLQTTGRDITHCSLHVVRDPFDEVAAVLVLDIQHLFVDLLHGHSATEDSGDSEITSVTRITSSHHVLGVEHLLSQFRDGQR